MKRLELTKDGSNLIISIGLLNKSVSSIEVSELKKFLNDDKSTSISMYSDLPSGKCVEKPDCANAELDGSGRCLGYSKVNDDEPIEVCKDCSKHSLYDECNCESV